jgi:hypothetical protein
MRLPEVRNCSDQLHCKFRGAECTSLAHSVSRIKTCYSAFMIYLSDLIKALREELQEYGEMLARFEDAAACGNQGSPEEVLATAARLQAQEEVIELKLRHRHQIQCKLARCLGLPEAAGLADVISLLPRREQLLVGALTDENKDLFARVQKRQLTRRSGRLAESRLAAA